MRIKDFADHEDKNSPKIEIPTVAKISIPSLARNSKIPVDFSFEKQTYICSYLLKILEDVIGLSARRSRYGYLKIVT